MELTLTRIVGLKWVLKCIKCGNLEIDKMGLMRLNNTYEFCPVCQEDTKMIVVGHAVRHVSMDNDILEDTRVKLIAEALGR